MLLGVRRFIVYMHMTSSFESRDKHECEPKLAKLNDDEGKFCSVLVIHMYQQEPRPGQPDKEAGQNESQGRGAVYRIHQARQGAFHLNPLPEGARSRDL